MGGRYHTENRSGVTIPPHFQRESKQYVFLYGLSQHLDFVLNLMWDEEKDISKERGRAKGKKAKNNMSVDHQFPPLL